MRKSTCFILAGLLLAVALPVSAAELAPQAVAARAIGQLGQTMRKKLLETVQKYGAEGAIDVCATDAPVIVSGIERDLGVSIKRTSLKLRNPRNAPDPVERELLETLAAAAREGKPLPSGVTPFPNDPRRFFKTITVERACLNCHGDPATMSEKVRREIAARYPDDRATGYKEGDFRGIISVSVK